jgi:hypothetical protein
MMLRFTDVAQNWWPKALLAALALSCMVALPSPSRAQTCPSCQEPIGEAFRACVEEFEKLALERAEIQTVLLLLRRGGTHLAYKTGVHDNNTLVLIAKTELVEALSKDPFLVNFNTTAEQVVKYLIDQTNTLYRQGLLDREHLDHKIAITGERCVKIQKQHRCPVAPNAVIAAESVLTPGLCPSLPGSGDPEPTGPLSGTWIITGSQPGGGRPRIEGTVDLKVMPDQTKGPARATEHWGNAVSKACTGFGAPASPFFYEGTIEWKKDSFFPSSFVYFTDFELNTPSAQCKATGALIDCRTEILLCTSSPDSTQARGNFRDSRDVHGAFIQWEGTAGGFIVPETVEGSSHTFTAVKK